MHVVSFFLSYHSICLGGFKTPKLIAVAVKTKKIIYFYKFFLSCFFEAA